MGADRVGGNDDIIVGTVPGEITLEGKKAGETPSFPIDKSLIISGGEIEIPLGEFEKAISNKAEVMSGFRMVPYFKAGTTFGVRFFAVRSGGLIDRMGIKNGDIVRQVNRINCRGIEVPVRHLLSIAPTEKRILLMRDHDLLEIKVHLVK